MSKYNQWRWDRPANLLRHQFETFWIPLGEIRTAEDVLGSMFQVTTKPWVTGIDMLGLVKFFRDEFFDTTQSGDRPAGG